jgi:hypothetical protein
MEILIPNCYFVPGSVQAPAGAGLVPLNTATGALVNSGN